MAVLRRTYNIFFHAVLHGSPPVSLSDTAGEVADAHVVQNGSRTFP
jgi:hypothetical protein